MERHNVLHTLIHRSVATVAAFMIVGATAGCGITGHQIVQSRVIVAGGAVTNVRVDCPTGKKVLGGGFSIETPNELKVYASDPSDGRGNIINNGWNVMVMNSGTLDRQTTAIAICADAQ